MQILFEHAEILQCIFAPKHETHYNFPPQKHVEEF